MGDNDVLIQIKADVADINAKLTDIKGNISKVTDETKKMGSDSKSSWEMFAAGIASTVYLVQQAIQKMQQMVQFVGDLANAYGQAELSGIKLNAVLAAHNVGDLTEAYKEYAKEVEDLTGIHHTEIENLQTVMTTMGVLPSQMKDATQAAIALHNVFGKDLTSSAELVAQAMEGNFRGLQRLIPQLKGAETGSISAAQVLDILKNSLGDVNEQVSEAYVTKVEKFNSAWKDFKETIGDKLVPVLTKALDLMTDIVKKTPSLLKMALMNPGEVLPLPGEPGSVTSPAKSTDAALKAGDKRFVKPPSHLLDALMKQWREKSPQLQAQTFADTALFGEGTGVTGDLSQQFNDMMSPIVAQATKLQEQFKQVAGARGVIDQWLFGQLHAEDIKESLEMIKTDWDYFEKSKLLEERTAMNKVMNDELQITKDLNDATRARGNYEITERQMIEATIEATQRQIKAETDRWNAMRLPKDADDWTAMNAQAQKIDELTEKMKNLNDQLAKTATPQTIVVALRKYADESADVWKQIGDAGTNAMKGLEDSLVDMCTTGTVSFQKMADAIIADIARICIKAGITGPLSKGLSNLMTFGNWSGTEDMDVLAGFMSAKGNIFQNGEIVRFRLGGIVNRPTFFPMKNGTGLMGEAGPEAVMPLSRTKDGRLGVTMPSGGDSGGSNVNIIYALDTKSFEDYLKRNPRPVINTIDQAIKDNSGLRNTIKRFTR